MIVVLCYGHILAKGTPDASTGDPGDDQSGQSGAQSPGPGAGDGKGGDQGGANGGGKDGGKGDLVDFEPHARAATEAEAPPGQLALDLGDRQRQAGRQAFDDRDEAATV